MLPTQSSSDEVANLYFYVNRLQHIVEALIRECQHKGIELTPIDIARADASALAFVQSRFPERVVAFRDAFIYDDKPD